MASEQEFTKADVLSLSVAFVLLGALLVWVTHDKAFADGVKSVKQVDPAPLVAKAAEEARYAGRQEGYDMGVTHTVKAALEYIQDSCTNKGEITAGGVTYMCLPRQEM
jgi:hypothetical protein